VAPLTHEHGSTDLVRLHVAAGVALDPDLVLSPRVRRAVDIAQDVGGPLLATLDAAAEAEDDALRATRAVAVATAQARTVAGGLVLAPVLLVPVIGRIAGVDLLAFYSSPPGCLVLLVGLGLLGLGAVVARGLVARAVRPAPGVLVEEAVELTAVAVAAGAAMPEALRLAGSALPALRDPLTRLALDLELGIRRDGASEVLTGMARLRTVLTTATLIGAPTLEALRRLARDLRAAELARALAAAERIPAQLTFPTTLLLLPATVLLIAAPLIAAGLRGVVT
jgi:Flp pilus assembly protein TadB